MNYPSGWIIRLRRITRQSLNSTENDGKSPEILKDRTRTVKYSALGADLGNRHCKL